MKFCDIMLCSGYIDVLNGYSNQGGTADVWILRDEEGKIIAFTMQIFTNS